MSDEVAETPGPVELSFTYTEDEYVAAARLFFSRHGHPGFDRALKVGFAAALVLILALAGDPYLAGIMAAFLVVGVAAGYYAERVRPRSAFRRDPKFRDAYAVRFAESGIGIRSKDFEASFDWGYYTGVVESPDFLFFVYGEDLYFLVPKRALRGRREEAALRELLRRKMGAKLEPYGLPAADARAPEGEYVPPAEPPDWR